MYQKLNLDRNLNTSESTREVNTRGWGLLVLLISLSHSSRCRTMKFMGLPESTYLNPSSRAD